jgi:hypothetical protein
MTMLRKYQRADSSCLAIAQLRAVALLLGCVLAAALVWCSSVLASGPAANQGQVVESVTALETFQHGAVLPPHLFRFESTNGGLLVFAAMGTFLTLFPRLIRPSRLSMASTMLPPSPGLRGRPHLHAYRR